ncbi:2,3-diaminopropionate biosynthesis protein SbnB [Pseudomonas prosekii]|uniref:2,3-diaminopropionate biosynthesis protein SbnB n=1 Tax=Pseudomonas prosekii TaxID=1148509 RepID=UPI00387B6FC9
MFEFSVVSGRVIRNILEEQPRLALRSVEAAYLAHHHGQTINPDSYFLRFPQAPANRIIALPASVAGDINVAGIKWISSFPSNIAKGIPRASAALILNDQQTGYPFACLEASLISAARTAASAVLGAYWCNRQSRNARSISFIGAGIIARNIFDTFIADEWNFDRVGIHDTFRDYSVAFQEHVLHSSGLPAFIDTELEEALRADIVVFATNGGSPYVPADWRFESRQVVLNISLRDLAPESILAANNVFDDVEHCLKAATSPHLAEQLSGDRAFVTGTLAQLILGEVTLPDDRARIFSPFGMGILDLALGKHVYEHARKQGTVVPIDGFFAETSRW